MHILSNSQAPDSRSRNSQTGALRNPLSFGVPFLLVFFAALASVCAVPFLAAQAPATPPDAPRKALHPQKHTGAGHSKPSPAHLMPEPPPQPPPAPEPPHWPVNDKPAQASITWDSHGLRIDATNSSLHQIMKDVATITGTKVEGLGADERVFGAYGPGLARDVLSQLLQGAGYNVLMIGDQGKGAPRQIVLSSRHPGDKSPASTQDEGDTPAPEEDDPDAQDPPEEPPPIVRPGFGPGGPRTPQQMMQDREQRQLQMQQMNQEQLQQLDQVPK